MSDRPTWFKILKKRTLSGIMSGIMVAFGLPWNAACGAHEPIQDDTFNCTITATL